MPQAAQLRRKVIAGATLALVPLGGVQAAVPSQQATRAVAWGSVSFRVPSDWPVYDLARDPSRCLRLDVHAVYLGAANPAAICPARVVGRTEALQVEPDSAAARGRAALAAAAAPAQLGAGGPAAADVVDSHEIVRRLSGLGVVVTASYATQNRVAQEILASFRPTRRTAIAPPAGQPLITEHKPRAPRRGRDQFTRAPSAPAGTGAGTAASISSGTYTGPGFDACTAPSSASMTAWLASPYRSVGVYLGGANRACGDGNLSASWVAAVTRQGWRLAPLYVGYQAPCVTQGGLARFSTSPAAAAGQAAAQARDAVNRAGYFGLPSGSPLYFDLEGYDTGDSACRAAVLAFSSAWTVELHRLGFRSGFYSGSLSGIHDFDQAYGSPGFTAPDGVWMAHWNGVPSVFGDAYVSDRHWTNHQRMHQYQGGTTQTYGGVSINIDINYDDGLVVTAGTGSSSIGYGAGIVGPGAPGFSTSGSWISGAPQGLRGVMLWTYSSGSVATASATWAPVLSPGRYNVAAYIPSDHAGGHARYAVSGATTAAATINEGSYSNAFVPVGQFATDALGRLRVRLTNDGDPAMAHTIGADAMRFSWAGPLVPGQAWRAPADFTGDGLADVAVWRPATGTWWVRGYPGVHYGIAGDIPVAGDYTGDGRAELALWRPSDGRWYIRGLPAVRWGQRGDIPVVADFTGDGRVDLAVWRWTTGTWWIRGVAPVRWGIPGDVPIPADYNGDGRAEVAMWRPSSGDWYVLGRAGVRWGVGGDMPVPTRLRSRGPVDQGIWRPSNGTWYVPGATSIRWGVPGDVAVPADITGGGLADHAIWRPSSGTWYIKDEPAIRWGLAGDIPV